MRKSIASEEGMTLVEVLVALVILTTAVAALTAGMGTLAFGSDRHRKTATADTIARRRAEELKLEVRQADPNLWCRSETSTVIKGYSVRTTPVGSCNNATSQVQQVTISVSMPEQASATLKATVRKP
jgi:type II secretion system protein I